MIEIICTAIACLAITFIMINFMRNEYNLRIKKGPSRNNRFLKEILNVAFEKESIEASAEHITNKIKDFFEVKYCTLFSYSTDAGLKILNSDNYSIDIPEFEKYFENILRAELIESNTNKSTAGYKMYSSSDIPLQYPTSEERKIYYFNFTALVISCDTVGALLIEHTASKLGKEAKRKEKEFLTLATNYISITLQNIVYHSNIEYIAWHDALTGQYNKAYMMVDLEKKIIDARIKNSIFYIAVIDIDYFKKFNDTYGHLVGDVVLKEVSKTIKAALGLKDSIYRFGGEEFILFIDSVAENKIVQYIDNVRQKTEELCITNDTKELKVTISIGFSQYPNDAKEIEELIKDADIALYQSKETGRNKVTKFNKGENNI